MNFLAIERSGQTPGAALFRNGVCAASCRFQPPVRGTASDAWMAGIRRLLLDAGTTAAQLHAVIVGTGPGSFSGIRGVLGAAQGMTLPFDNATVLGAASTVAIAWQHLGPATAGATAGVGATAVIIGDARRGQLWCVRYRREEHGLSCWRPDLVAWQSPCHATVEFMLFRHEDFAGAVENFNANGDLLLSPDAARLAALDPAAAARIVAADADAAMLGAYAAAHPETLVREPLPIYLHAAV